MTDNFCSDPVGCLNGNCPGCRDGQLWCQDPRCAPYCRSCGIVDDHDFNAGMVIIVIIIALLTILFIVWFVYGPQLFHPHSDHYRADVLMPEEGYHYPAV